MKADVDLNDLKCLVKKQNKTKKHDPVVPKYEILYEMTHCETSMS